MSGPLGRDIEQTLERWMESVAPDRAPGGLLEQTFARTMSTAQDRRLPWRRIQVGTRAEPALGSLARVALLALLVIAVMTIGLFVAGGGPPTQSTPAPSPRPSASSLGPPPVSVTPDSIAVDGPVFLATDGTAPWLVTTTGHLVRIDLATNTIGESGQIGRSGDPYQELAYGADAFWITDWDTRQIFRVDPDTLEVTDTITAGAAFKGIVATADAIWVADTRGGSVLRIDPATNEVIATVEVGPTGPSGPNWLASGFDSIWVDVPNNKTISRIDPVTSTVQATITVPVGMTACGGFGIGKDTVWVTGCGEAKRMLAVDPSDNTEIATIELGGYAGHPIIIDGAPWFSLDRDASDNGQIVRLDPVSNEIDRILAPDVPFGGGGNLVMVGGSVWVPDPYNNTVLRLPLSAFAD